MPRRKDHRPPPFTCIKCGFGARIYKNGNNVILLGRMRRYPFHGWVCRICVSELKEPIKRAWFGPRAS